VKKIFVNLQYREGFEVVNFKAMVKEKEEEEKEAVEM